MILIIDRFEGEIAVCEDEDKNRYELPICELYSGAKAGDWFNKIGNSSVYMPEETKRARMHNVEILRSLVKGE